MEDNPMLLQSSPVEGSTPLVLVHDGGGTIFPYLRLGSLDRDVWAIHDPNWSTSELFEGALDEMAETYIDFIQDAGIQGPILLGGWSLGGYISLTIAKKVAKAVTSPGFSIAGLLLIDTPFHIPMCKLPPPGPEPDFSNLPELIRKSFANCDVYLSEWELPRWDAPACQGRPVRVVLHEKVYTIPDGSILQKQLGQKWHTVEMQSFHTHDPISKRPTVGPPPAVLMRCDRRSPNGANTELPCHIDQFRPEPLLHWDGSYPNFIKGVIDVDSTHYDIFDPPHIDNITQQLNEGIDILDSLTVL